MIETARLVDSGLHMRFLRVLLIWAAFFEGVPKAFHRGLEGSQLGVLGCWFHGTSENLRVRSWVSLSCAAQCTGCGPRALAP